MTMPYHFPVLKDEFKGKRVLVTGGTKGMGEAISSRGLRGFYRKWRRSIPNNWCCG